MKKLTALIIALAVLFSMALWAGGKKEAPTEAAAEGKYGGTLVYGHPRNLYSFDPLALPGGNRPIYHIFYNTLVAYDSQGNLVPELASEWEFSDDGLSLTFTLREGVKFHNGREMVADDVVFSLERAQDKKVAANIRPLALSVTGAEAVDDTTVVFRFDAPNPAVFDLLDLLFIQNKDTIDSIKNKPAGTGPFMLKEWVPGTRAHAVRFEDYWNTDEEGNPLPYLDEIIIKPFPDAQAMVVNLEAGAADLIQEPSFNDLARLEKTGKYTTFLGTPSVFKDVLLNVTKPPMDNKKVRQAIQYAIDREKFVETHFKGFSRATCVPVPDFHMAYDPAFEDMYTFDLDKAKQLLEEAGYPDGFEVECMTAFKVVGGSEILAQIMQSDLAKIGVRMKIVDQESAVVRPRWFQGDYVMSLHNYGRAAKDPASLFGTTVAFSPETGITQYRGERYTELIEQGVSILDPEKRKEIYQEVVRITLEESFTIAVATEARPFAMQKYVKDVSYSLDNFLDFEKTWLDK